MKIKILKEAGLFGAALSVVWTVHAALIWCGFRWLWTLPDAWGNFHPTFGQILWAVVVVNVAVSPLRFSDFESRPSQNGNVVAGGKDANNHP